MDGARSYLKVASALAVAAVVLATLLMVAGGGSGSTYNKVVRGHIWDSGGNGIGGADVAVNIKDGATTRATYSETTDSVGFYSITVLASCWDVGNTIEVVAEFDGEQETNATAATSASLQWVNVTMPFEIPEFGSTTGLLVTGGLIGAVAVVALVYFRKR